MSQSGTRIKRGDMVRVIAGKDKGKEGKVLDAIAPDDNPKKPQPARLRVEGINVMIKHRKARPRANVPAAAAQQQSGRIEMAAPIYSSKVMLVCPNCGQPTRIGIAVTTTGHRHRACKKCGKSIE